jgi:predicted ATPase
MIGGVARRVSSPVLVGRDAEVARLDAALERAAAGRPAIVVVAGEAGVGKTRLITELTARCAAQGTRVLAGGCVPVGEGALPYAPIVEILRVLLGDVGAGEVRKLAGASRCGQDLRWRSVVGSAGGDLLGDVLGVAADPAEQ